MPDHLEQNTDARVLVLRSANPQFFIAHYDVAQILTFPVGDAPVRGTEVEGLPSRLLLSRRYRTMAIPTICEIDGRVGGGGRRVLGIV